MALQEDQARDRAAAVERVIASEASRRLIVAGPGTGKTYTFREAFRRVGDRGLALTFIQALTRELRRDLPESVTVRTFHGHCVFLMRSVYGSEPMLYPALNEIIATDVGHLTRRRVSVFSIDRAYQDLDEGSDLLAEAERLSSYYSAVSFAGIVLRCLRRFQSEPGKVPIYPLVVVDEYQDFSRLEIAFIDVLATASKVLIAGDDDQALYSFKPASPSHIRDLARGGTVETFELPFCSRCTEVVVDSVNDVIRQARLRGNLVGRLEKPFRCYLPAKATDSRRYPALIHVNIENQSTDSDHLGRYMVEQIGQISPQEVAESVEGSYPTALIVGMEPFLDIAIKAVRAVYPHLVDLRRDSVLIEPAVGYELLARDSRSRLGWRIVLECYPNFAAGQQLTETLRAEHEVADILPPEYRDLHLGYATMQRRVVNGLSDAEEEVRLTTHEKRSVAQIRIALRLDAPAPPMAVPDGQPAIVGSTMIRAKGLSAGHVFVVGFMDRYLPSLPNAITDDEVCAFLVALSRTRKQCHLISCATFAGLNWSASSFLGWIRHRVVATNVNDAYFSHASGAERAP